MSNKSGRIYSADITSKDADVLKEFYQKVLGWNEGENVKMEDENGEYTDFIMTDSNKEPVSGICFKRGVNSNQPKGWVIYIAVTDVDESIKQCLNLNGKVLKDYKDEKGKTVFALIEDPENNVIGLVTAQ